MNANRRIFLIFWIPIVVVVITMLLCHVGSVFSSGIYVGSVLIVSLNDALYYIIIVLVLSVALFIIVGLEDIKTTGR